MAGNANSGNHNPKPKTAKKGAELVQRCRGAILNCFDLVEREDGKTISQILAPVFRENPLRFMELAGKFCPKDIHAELSRTLSVEALTDAELIEIIRNEEPKKKSLIKPH